MCNNLSVTFIDGTKKLHVESIDLGLTAKVQHKITTFSCSLARAAKAIAIGLEKN
jgi:hypothetical protein